MKMILLVVILQVFDELKFTIKKLRSFQPFQYGLNFMVKRHITQVNN